MNNPKRLLITGFFLLIFGFIVPLLMILHIVRSTLFLNFLGFSASILGLFLGVAGAAGIVSRSRRKP